MEIEHSYTDELVCPYCGYEYSNSWELDDDDELVCPECLKIFIYYREITYHYVSAKTKETIK